MKQTIRSNKINYNENWWRQENQRIINHVKQNMGYPVARGSNELTGDTLLIKCLKYIPPTTTSSYEYTLRAQIKKEQMNHLYKGEEE